MPLAKVGSDHGKRCRTSDTIVHLRAEGISALPDTGEETAGDVLIPSPVVSF
jgi:hypothetical protein